MNEHVFDSFISSVAQMSAWNIIITPFDLKGMKA